MKKMIQKIILIFMILFLKSCSSYSNIDTKLFVSGIGVDVNEDGDFSLCFSYPDISGFSTESSSIKESGSISGFGKTFYEALRDASSKIHKTIDLEHAKVLILSSDLINDHNNFENLIDYFSHNPQISRRIYICVGDGASYDFLNFKPKTLSYSQNFISDLIENNSEKNGIKLVTLNNLLDFFSQNKVLLLPTLKLNDEKTTMSVYGSNIFKNYKLLRKINLKESMFINFLRGDNFKIFSDADYGKVNVSFQCENVKRNIKVLDYGSLNFILKFDFNTWINNCSDSEHTHINENFIKDMKYILDKNIKENCINLINKFYKNGIDILNFENFLYKFHTNTWKNCVINNANWMESISVDLNIQNNILNIGNVSF